MVTYNWIKLREHPELVKQSAKWFSSKWGVPAVVYEESIPQWYVVLDEKETIVGGAGVIENDFHNRPDLTPNLCALFVEPEKRKQGIAKRILAEIRKKCINLGMKNFI